MHDPSKILRCQALQVLVKIRSTHGEVLVHLEHALQDNDRDVRYDAARAFEEPGVTSPSVIPALSRATNDSEQMVRSAATRALNRVVSAAVYRDNP